MKISKVLLNSFYLNGFFQNGLVVLQILEELTKWTNYFKSNHAVKNNIVIIVPLADSFTVYKALYQPYCIYWPQPPSEVSTTYTVRSVLEPPAQTLQWIFASNDYFLLPHSYICSCPTPVRDLCLWVPNSELLPGMGSSFLLVLFLVIGVQQKLNSEHQFLLSSLDLTSVHPPCNAGLNPFHLAQLLPRFDIILLLPMS